MHFHIAQQVLRSARDGADRGGVMAGRDQGVAHAHAIGVALFQQRQVELAGHGRAAQKGALEAHAFFLGKADDFKMEGQLFALFMQVAHDGDRQHDAEPAIVFAAIAHGVVVRARHQRLRARHVRLITAHHIADRVYRHLHAGLAHPGGQLRGRLLVGRRHVGAGQVVAAVAVAGQGFAVAHDGRAESQAHVEQVVQAQLGDALDLAQRLKQLVGPAVFQAPREGGDDVLARQAFAGRAFHGQDERKTEPGVVVGVQPLQGGEFFRAAQVQAGFRLLARGLGRQLAGNRRLAGQFRVGPDQAQLFVWRGQAQHPLQFALERRQAGKRPRRRRAAGDPGRVFVDAVQLLDKLFGAAGVQVGKGSHGYPIMQAVMIAPGQGVRYMRSLIRLISGSALWRPR